MPPAGAGSVVTCPPRGLDAVAHALELRVREGGRSDDVEGGSRAVVAHPDRRSRLAIGACERVEPAPVDGHYDFRRAARADLDLDRR